MRKEKNVITTNSNNNLLSNENDLGKKSLLKYELFEENTDSTITCLACKHYCRIKKNGFGLCGTRKNVEGELKLISYAKPVSINLDPIEKKPLHHFLPASTTHSIGFLGCNFRCDYCQNYSISTCRGIKAEKELINSVIVPPKEFINQALMSNAKSVAFTYNEPITSIEYCLDSISEAKKNNLGSVFVSNGYASKESTKLLRDLSAINIDLKSFNPKFYEEVCGAKLEGVIDSIKSFKKMGCWVEVTTLIVPTKNDSINELKKIASFIKSINKNIAWHVIGFTPHHKMLSVPPTPNKKLLEAKQIGLDEGLRFVYTGNNSSQINTNCPNCDSLLITRNYYESNIIGLNKNKCSNCGKKISGVFE